MEIKIERNGSTVTLQPQGNLDYITSPELDAVIAEETKTATNLILDFSNVPYIASAGLRSLIKAEKCLGENGTLKIVHVNASVMTVLDISGFTSIFDIE